MHFILWKDTREYVYKHMLAFWVDHIYQKRHYFYGYLVWFLKPFRFFSSSWFSCEHCENIYTYIAYLYDLYMANCQSKRIKFVDNLNVSFFHWLDSIKRCILTTHTYIKYLRNHLLSYQHDHMSNHHFHAFFH